MDKHANQTTKRAARSRRKRLEMSDTGMAGQLNVGDLFRMPAYGTGYRVWMVDGVHLGGLGQESVVSLVALDKSAPTTDGGIYVPTRIFEAANLERVRGAQPRTRDQIVGNYGGDNEQET